MAREPQKPKRKSVGVPFSRGFDARRGPGGPRDRGELRKLCRVHTAAAVEALARIVTGAKEKSRDRILAATALLDRGWGKPTTVLGGDPEQPLSVHLRNDQEVLALFRKLEADAKAETETDLSSDAPPEEGS